MGSTRYCDAAEACDRRGSRSRTFAVLALLTVLVSTSMAAPSPAQPPPGMAEVFIYVEQCPCAVRSTRPGLHRWDTWPFSQRAPHRARRGVCRRLSDSRRNVADGHADQLNQTDFEPAPDLPPLEQP